MSITDELREWWLHKFPIMDKELHQDFVDIADRIDAEYERKVAEMTSSWDYWEYTHVELPKDADGEPIRFKDKVTVPWSEKVYEVSGFSYQENVHLGTMTIWINVHENGEYKALCAADSCRHHEPTVEDVLREFTDAILDWSGKSGTVAETGTWSDVAADFIAKLQLKETE